MGPLIRRLKNWDAHHRLFVAAGAAIAAVALTVGHWSTAVVTVVAWDVFGAVLLFLAWVRIAAGEPARFEKGVRLQDFGNTVIFFSVLTAACMSLFAVAYLLGTGRPGDREMLIGHVLLSIATVVCSWSLVHTVFTLHYAHLFHSARKNGKGGLAFPEEPSPDYLDFAYFSFVIGMTCQVSDVQVTGRRIRRLVLLHGIVSFAFNAAILALAINIVSTMVTR